MTNKQQTALENILAPVEQNLLVSLSLLYPHSRNFREHPPEQIKKLKASLERWGQVRSIVAKVNSDGTYTIVAGHGIVQAAQSLVDANASYYERFGKLRVDVIPSSWSEAQITGYLVADNVLSNDATDDETLLAELLKEQQSAGYDLASLGSDDESLRQMLESLTHASNDEWSDALENLPDGDKAPFKQMTFTLSNEQADLVEDALGIALEDKDNFPDMSNQNSNGNALAYIIKFYLDMGKGDASDE